jgi:hypothetical protein
MSCHLQGHSFVPCNKRHSKSERNHGNERHSDLSKLDKVLSGNR